MKRIKICGLNNADNIRRLLRIRPDYIGFIFYPGSPRFVKPDPYFAAYARTIRNVKKVGVFVDESYEAIIERMLDYGLDYVQLHGDEPPEFCRILNSVIPVIKAFAISNHFDFDTLNEYSSSCQYFLFDYPSAQYGGSGQSFDWSSLARQPIPLPFFLSGGIGPADGNKIRNFQHPSLAALDLNSRFEVRAGEKNINLLKRFLYEL